MSVIKQYVLPLVFICVMAAIFGFAGFMLFVAFILLAFKVAAEVSFEAAMAIVVVGLGILLLLAIHVIYKVYRKDV